MRKTVRDLKRHASNQMNKGDMSVCDWNILYADSGYDNVGSGPGSLVQNNKELIKWLSSFVQKYKIRNILDLGCGDMQWIPSILESLDIDYTGIDGSSNIINRNKTIYPEFNFIECDIVQKMPTIKNTKVWDISLLKDVIQHLNDSSLSMLLGNIDTMSINYKIIIAPGDTRAASLAVLETYGYKLIYKYPSGSYSVLNTSNNRKAIICNDSNTEMKQIFIKTSLLHQFEYESYKI